MDETPLKPVRLDAAAKSLILVAGIPGSGKSTFMGTLPPEPSIAVLDSDSVRHYFSACMPPEVPYRSYRWAVHLVYHLIVIATSLSGWHTVVVHHPATAPNVRAALLTLARQSNRNAHLIWMHSTPTEALIGQHERGRLVRARVFEAHVSGANRLLETLESGAPSGWASVRIVDRAHARGGLVILK